MGNELWRSAWRTLVVITALSAAGALFATRLVWEGANISGQLTGKAFQVMKLTRDPAGPVSGNKVLGIPKMATGIRPSADTVNYRLNIPAAGTYYLWARVHWESGCGNTFYISMPGVTKAILGGDATYNALHWINWIDAGKPKKLVLHQGINTIALGARESGTQVNQFLLTDDPKYRPADIYADTDLHQPGGDVTPGVRRAEQLPAHPRQHRHTRRHRATRHRRHI